LSKDLLVTHVQGSVDGFQSPLTREFRVEIQAAIAIPERCHVNHSCEIVGELIEKSSSDVIDKILGPRIIIQV